MTTGYALTATVHDPVGRMAEATERLAGTLRAEFSDICVNISDATRPEVFAALERLGARIMTHAAGEAIIGRARRDAIAMAGEGEGALYADFDHMLRWVEFGAGDLRRILAEHQDADLMVIGRSDQAFAAEPRRLRDTERLVNHAFGLLTGNRGWDLMFAIRRMSPAAVNLIVSQSQVDTLANDVEWPLLARQAGLTVRYKQSDALFYRTIEEFGDDGDGSDADPLQWIRRLEFAALHVSAMRPFLTDAE